MPRATQEAARKTRQNIIDVSIKIITLEGEDQLTFSKIAQKAGISRSGINCHFKKKENLLTEIRPILAERVRQALSFSSPEEFFESWKDAVDNDRMFRNLIRNLGGIISSEEGCAGLQNLIQGDKDKAQEKIYMALGYAVTHINQK